MNCNLFDELIIDSGGSRYVDGCWGFPYLKIKNDGVVVLAFHISMSFIDLFRICSWFFLFSNCVFLEYVRTCWCMGFNTSSIFRFSDLQT